MSPEDCIAKVAPSGAKRGRKPGGFVRFPGLSRDARALGVSPSHLFHCLSGARTSVRLMTRYQALKASAQPSVPPNP